ncbi:MAG: hypothetical protein WCL00_11535, partial [Bacteroidota bacterium]
NKVLEGLEFVFVEIPKFKAASFNEKRLQVLWLRYLSEIRNATETISPELLEVLEIREAIELLQESGYSKSELMAYDKYWDSISIERTLLSDSFVEGKIEGIELMIVNGFKTGITIESLSNMAQISPEKIKEILKKHDLLIDDEIRERNV